jgi:tRNA-dihydrouridine synthase
MEGVMHHLFCAAVAELKLVSGWMTPFIRISVSVPGHKAIYRFLEPFLGYDLPVVVQLLGSDHRKIADAVASILEFDVAGIDLNFACPSKRVVQHGGGGAMLKNSDAMRRIISTLRERYPQITLSAKIRTGFDSPLEMHSYIPDLCSCGVDFLSVHYRTVSELYNPSPDRRERMNTAAQLSSVPIFGSGDVYSINDAIELLQSGCSGVMGARGWLKDPLLLKRIQYINSPNSPTLPTPEDARNILFDSMRSIAKNNPSQFRARSSFMEIAAFMWGHRSQRFQQIKNMSDSDLMGERSLPLG